MSNCRAINEFRFHFVKYLRHRKMFQMMFQSRMKLCFMIYTDFLLDKLFREIWYWLELPDNLCSTEPITITFGQTDKARSHPLHFYFMNFCVNKIRKAKKKGKHIINAIVKCDVYCSALVAINRKKFVLASKLLLILNTTRCLKMCEIFLVQVRTCLIICGLQLIVFTAYFKLKNLLTGSGAKVLDLILKLHLIKWKRL